MTISRTLTATCSRLHWPGGASTTSGPCATIQRANPPTVAIAGLKSLRKLRVSKAKAHPQRMVAMSPEKMGESIARLVSRFDDGLVRRRITAAAAPNTNDNPESTLTSRSGLTSFGCSVKPTSSITWCSSRVRLRVGSKDVMVTSSLISPRASRVLRKNEALSRWNAR